MRVIKHVKLYYVKDDLIVIMTLPFRYFVDTPMYDRHLDTEDIGVGVRRLYTNKFSITLKYELMMSERFRDVTMTNAAGIVLPRHPAVVSEIITSGEWTTPQIDIESVSLTAKEPSILVLGLVRGRSLTAVRFQSGIEQFKAVTMSMHEADAFKVTGELSEPMNYCYSGV